jgi:hypothetical protein
MIDHAYRAAWLPDGADRHGRKPRGAWPGDTARRISSSGRSLRHELLVLAGCLLLALINAAAIIAYRTRWIELLTTWRSLGFGPGALRHAGRVAAAWRESLVIPPPDAAVRPSRQRGSDHHHHSPCESARPPASSGHGIDPSLGSRPR